MNTSQLLGDNKASFLFCIPIPNEYLCNVFIDLVTQPITLWNNAYLIQEAFVFLSNSQITPEEIKNSYLENYSRELDLSYLTIEEIVVRSIEQLFYYAQTNQLDIYELPSELILIFDQYTDINNEGVDNVSNFIQSNVNKLLNTIKLTFRSSNYLLNSVTIWFASKSYLPNSTEYKLDNLSLYLVQGFDDNLIRTFFFSKSRKFDVKDFITNKINDLHIEAIVKPYF